MGLPLLFMLQENRSCLSDCIYVLVAAWVWHNYREIQEIGEMVHPVQPYFAFSADTYYKRTLAGEGIAHIYEYACQEAEGNQLMVIPDGSIDMMFDTTAEDLSARVAGTVLSGTSVPMEQGHVYFGVRFAPGVMPAFLDSRFQDLIEANLDLSACMRDAELAERIRELETFQQRADYFVQFYRAILCANEHSAACPDKELLFRAVRDHIQQLGGRVMIKELEDYTGYTSRYIDKVFQEYAGMSPKTFARIIRFQTAINHLDHDNQISFSDLAADHGYYDQPQFIRDFKRFTETTPKEYRRKIISSNYVGKFVVE